MTERWQREMTKLRGAELPANLWDRVAAGTRLEPLPARASSRVLAGAIALLAFVVAAALLWAAFARFGPSVKPLGGPDVIEVPPAGETSAVFLPDGRPVFIVHHEDGTVSVVDSLSPHRAWGFEEPVVWCPSTRQLVEWAHEAHFNEYGTWESAGPAPSSLATFAFRVVERDATGEPATITVGAMQPPDRARSPAVTDPSRPPFCPGVHDGTKAVTFTVGESQIWESPADAVAAQPVGWIAVRGQLQVASDGFVQLCAEVQGDQCEGGAIVRGIDGVGLMVNVLQKYPGQTAYEKPRLWLARVRGAVLDDLAIGDIRSTG